MVLTFTPEVPVYYLIIGTAELGGSSSSYSVLARMNIDGTSCADFTREPDQTKIFINHFATQKVVNLTAASHTIKIRFRSESSSAHAYARRARILAIPLSGFAFQEVASTQSVNTTYATYQDIVSRTFSADAAGLPARLLGRAQLPVLLAEHQGEEHDRRGQPG